MRAGRRYRGAILAAAALVAAAACAAASAERPANDLTRYVAGLRTAAMLAEQAREATASLTGKDCGAFAPASAKLVEAANASRSAFEAYRKANTRFGTEEEIGLIASVAGDLHEALALLAKAADETGQPSAAEKRSAEREVGIFQAVVAEKIEDRLRVEGLADVLSATSFAAMKGKVVAGLQERLRTRAEAELRRLTGLGIRLDVPLKQQIHDKRYLSVGGGERMSSTRAQGGNAKVLAQVLAEAQGAGRAC